MSRTYKIYGDLRASTKDQDALRAKGSLEKFALERGHTVDFWFVENESGATLKRPELFRLLDHSRQGDILLIEQVDRITRLNTEDWESLKKQITEKGIILIALDLPTSHQFIKAHDSDEFTKRMQLAFNGMMLDVLAAVARKDYEDRRRRQMEGIEKAKLEGKYKGKGKDLSRRRNIAALIKDKYSLNEIVRMLKCSKATIVSVKKEMKNESQ